MLVTIQSSGHVSLTENIQIYPLSPNLRPGKQIACDIARQRDAEQNYVRGRYGQEEGEDERRQQEVPVILLWISFFFPRDPMCPLAVGNQPYLPVSVW